MRNVLKTFVPDLHHKENHLACEDLVGTERKKNDLQLSDLL